jgi:hypothetical protein
MNRSRIFWGGTLLVLGILFLLENFNLLQVDVFEVISTYWPVLLILAGASLLIVKKSNS